MLPKFEYDQLYKFSVSLGLLLVALAAALPWFVLRESSVLLVDQKRLNELTPIARRTLESKQTDLSWVADNYQWASLCLVVAGAAVVAYGFVNWRKRQIVRDSTEDAHLGKAKFELAVMSEEEKRIRFAEQAAEGAAEAPNEITDLVRSEQPLRERETDDANKGQVKSDAVSTEVLDDLERLPDLFSEQLEVVENRVKQLFKAAFSETHGVTADVALKYGEVSKQYVDVVAKARDSEVPTYVVEVKLRRTARALLSGIEGAATSVAAASMFLDSRVPESVDAILFFVIDADLDDQAVRRLRELAQRRLADVSRLLRTPLRALLVTSSHLKEMDERELRQLVEETQPLLP